MNDRDKIRLAEAMEWTHVPAVGSCAFIRWKIEDGEDIGLMNNIQPFDPENDANDDYVVLEWMRTQSAEFVQAFKDALFDLRTYTLDERTFTRSKYSSRYELGDWAKATLIALKLLDTGEDRK